MKLVILLSYLQVAAISQVREKTYCEIPIVKPMATTSLTCTFPEDLSVSKKDFSVVHMNSTGKPVLDCLWVQGKLDCFDIPGYTFNLTVTNKLTILIPRVFSNMSGVYFCKISGSADEDSNLCHLVLEQDVHTAERNTPIIIGIAVGVGIVAVIIVIVFVVRSRYRRRLADSESKTEGESMLMPPKHSKNMSKEETVTKKFEAHLESKIKDMYPNTLESVYFVPPIYFNKIRYKTQHIADQVVYVPDSFDPTDMIHDKAMQHFLQCLRHITERRKEQMFVLTQFQYGDYLNNPGDDFQQHSLPMFSREEVTPTECVDFLIIHLKMGIIVGVVKAIIDKEGKNRDEMVANEVTEGIERLGKASHILHYFMSDQEHIPKVQQVLVLYNITESSFRSALLNHPTVLKNLKPYWCICIGQLSSHNIGVSADKASVSSFEKYWERMTAKTEDCNKISKKLYLTMIARFFGPATASCLPIQSDTDFYHSPKTVDQAVSFTGDMFERLTLHEQMTKLLNKPRVFLSGPPCTGKTRMLALVGRQWLSVGHTVHVISTSPEGEIAAMHLMKLLQQPAINTPALPFLVKCDLNDDEKVTYTLNHFKKRSGEETIFIILDEVNLQIYKKKDIQHFFSRLHQIFPDLHLWAAGYTEQNLSFKQPELHVEHLKDLLSCPSSVLRQLHQNENVSISKLYGESKYPTVTEGPPVKHIYHIGEGHLQEQQPYECRVCGKNIADFLTQTLCISADIDASATAREPTIKALWQPPSLRHSDVLILFECDVGESTPVVKSLVSSGIPVLVISPENQTDALDDEKKIALAAKVGHLLGLKRKVVVFVEGNSESNDVTTTWNRVRSFTSCTSQLILVHTAKS